MMIRYRSALTVALFAGIALGLCSRGLAQAGSALTSQSNGPPNSVTITQSVQPSFHIEPVVQRLAGRRGEVVPFTFEIASTGKAMDVMVAPVNLRQEASGIILHDETSPPSQQMRLTSPGTFRLAPGDSQIIRGEVTVPIARTNLLTYGILVKDRGQVSAPNDDPATKNQTKAGVRFVTQYVLRVEIETGVQDSGELSQVTLVEGQVRAQQGLPLARVYLDNPTDYAMECQVQGMINSNSTKKGKPFSLTMPSRSNLSGEEKNLVRVMPHSRIRLETPLEGLLMPGDQTLKILLSNGRRAVAEQSFGFSVNTGDFPAMESHIAFLGKEFSVQPAQIEVGRTSGASRTCNLKFTNNAINPESVTLRLRDLQGKELMGLNLSNEDVDVASGRTKTVRLMVANEDKALVTQFGYVEIHRRGETESTPFGRVPVILANGEMPVPQLHLEELQIVEGRAFELVVTNQGEGFIPVHANLRLASEAGHVTELADGYGKWLAPQESRRLRFYPEKDIDTGEYQVVLQVYTTEDQPPVQKTLVVKLLE